MKFALAETIFFLGGGEAVGRFYRRESCTICPHIVSRDTDLFNSVLVRCVGITALEGSASLTNPALFGYSNRH